MKSSFCHVDQIALTSLLSQQKSSQVEEPYNRTIIERKRKFVDTELAQDTEGNRTCVHSDLDTVLLCYLVTWFPVCFYCRTLPGPQSAAGNLDCRRWGSISSISFSAKENCKFYLNYRALFFVLSFSVNIFKTVTQSLGDHSQYLWKNHLFLSYSAVYGFWIWSLIYIHWCTTALFCMLLGYSDRLVVSCIMPTLQRDSWCLCQCLL